METAADKGICLLWEANGCVVSYSPKQVEKLKSKCLQRRQTREPVHLTHRALERLRSGMDSVGVRSRDKATGSCPGQLAQLVKKLSHTPVVGKLISLQSGRSTTATHQKVAGWIPGQST